MNGWESTRLSAFCATGSGSTPSRSQVARYYEGGTIPWVKSGELREGVISSTEEYVTEAALKETSVKMVPAGALLLAMYGATVGRLGILGIPATTNQAVCHIVPDPKVADTRFLFHALSHQVPAIIARGVGGAQPNISQGVIKDLLLPVPPIAEQRRIAEVLDRAEALRTKRRAALAQLDTLTQSIFLDLFGDPAANSRGWPMSKIGDQADVQGGLQVTTARKGLPEEVPYLRVANVYRNRLDLREIKLIRATAAEVARTTLSEGDLLIVEGHGNPEEIGRSCLWDGSIKRCIHQNHIIRARFNPTRVTPIYACHYLNSAGGRRHLLKAGKTTTGLNTISVSDVRGAPLALPPLEIQEDLARRIAAVEKLKSAQRASLAELDALFASLQHRAFRGEL
jgi:type I restriction enzyme S subunit